MAKEYGVRIIPMTNETDPSAETKMAGTFGTLTDARRYIHDRIVRWKGSPETWIIYERPCTDKITHRTYFARQKAMMYRTIVSPSRMVMPEKRWVIYETTEGIHTVRYVNADGSLGKIRKR